MLKAGKIQHFQSVLQTSGHFSLQIELQSPVSQNGFRTATGDACVSFAED